jgi:hypothetical protein
LLQNLFFISGCFGGLAILLWSFKVERDLVGEQRKKARDDFGKSAGRF